MAPKQLWLRLIMLFYNGCFIFRGKGGAYAATEEDTAGAGQNKIYSPIHDDGVTSVVAVTRDICLSGSQDKVLTLIPFFFSSASLLMLSFSTSVLLSRPRFSVSRSRLIARRAFYFP